MSYEEEKAVINLFHQLASGIAPQKVQRDTLPAALQQEAAMVGAGFDADSLEQGD